MQENALSTNITEYEYCIYKILKILKTNFSVLMKMFLCLYNYLAKTHIVYFGILLN